MMLVSHMMKHLIPGQEMIISRESRKGPKLIIVDNELQEDIQSLFHLVAP